MTYREVKAINNSLMGVYEDDYSAFVAYWVSNQPLRKKSDESLTMGSVIDTLLTKPEDYDNNFIIFKGKAPTAQVLSFCHKLADIFIPGEPLEMCYQRAYDAVGIQSPKLEGFLTKFEPYREYFNFLVDRGDKQVITTDQAAKASLIVDQLRNNTYTKDIVNASGPDVYNQLELYYTVKGMPLKGAIDRVLVSHKKKTILPIDFKSSHNVLDFKGSYYKYRYYRQGSYYTYLLSLWAKDKGLEDYTILPFMFVVCSTTGGQHWIYRMCEHDILIARIGGETTMGYKIKGWSEILFEIDYLSSKRDWAFPYECLVNNGIMELNIFK